MAWSPYIFLVIFVLLWGPPSVKAVLDKITWKFGWPGLHNLVLRMPPVTKMPTPYDATYTFNPGSASGTACLAAVFVSALVFRVSLKTFFKIIADTTKQLIFGGNAIKFYKIRLKAADNTKMPTYSEDRLAALKSEYAQAAEQPTNLRYGYVRAA